MMKQPNILFIMCDQMRHDAVGCNGNPHVQTPNLNRLAASGVNFTNSFTPDPICVPARACLTTGCYPHKCTGTKKNSGEIKEGFPLLGDELNKRGYETYAIGKLHYNPYGGPGEPRTTHGLKTTELMESGRILGKFDPKNKLIGLEDYHDYLHTVGWGGYTRGHGLGNNDVYAAPSPIPEEHYVDTWVANRAIDYMREHMGSQPEKPFFMWASFPKPHSAFDPPHPYNRMYDPREMPAPVGEMSVLQDRELDELVARHFDYMWDLLSPQAMKVIKAYYYGLITHQDKQIGKLLDFLEQNGLREDTIVVYTADHGEMLGDFGLYFKTNFYNGSVRVPLMISYPRRIAAGQVTDALAGLQDLLPTMLSLAGAPLEQKVDGIDLTPVLTGNSGGQAQGVRDYYVAQTGDDPGQMYMVASKEWKYIYTQLGGVEELYAQTGDLTELRNVATDQDPNIQQVKKDMRKFLIRWCEDNGDLGMLDGGDLKVTQRGDAGEADGEGGAGGKGGKSGKSKGKAARGNTFGRRWY
jgi:arylsulfatase A-like enzyme